ncbi:2-dehydro-3-deoxygalactonokinase [Allostella humosa]|nr:2-dehydro-3-deoxygalactonokinase [Stella humosa]
MAALLSVDWGTTSLRVYLLTADGGVLDEREAPLGIMNIAGGAFAAALHDACRPWLERHGPLPALLSGMIGSRQGWIEAPYLPCPVALDELGRHLTPITVPDFGPIRVAPGVTARDRDGVPDVMRGEECQIVGALALMAIDGGTFLLPGTHSKTVTVAQGRIIGFHTCMTGELFAALRTHTILGRLMGAASGDGSGFARGVDAARGLQGAGQLLHAIFAARTLRLFDELAEDEAADYLSGLLIGAELGGIAAGDGELILIGSADLADRYRRAARRLGIATRDAPAACVRAGHLALATQAGLVRR